MGLQRRVTMNGLMWLVGSGVGFASATSVMAEVLFVDQRVQGGAGDGSSWANAFANLQDALEAARIEAGTVDEIWITWGTYRPAPVNGDRTVSFELVDGVALLGGFTGVEATPEERPAHDIGTYLSGDLNEDDARDAQDEWVASTRDDNSFRVLRYEGSEAVRLDRLTISGGNQEVSTLSSNGGAALLTFGAPRVDLTDCQIRDNTCAAVAGAVFMSGAAEAVVERCVFRRNESAVLGGAVFMARSLANENRLEIIDSDFERNRVTGRLPNDAPTRSIGGGAIYSGASETVLTRSVFRWNSAETVTVLTDFDEAQGGAVLVEIVQSAPAPGQVRIEACEFRENSVVAGAGLGAFGGAVHIRNAGAEILDSVFAENEAEVADGIAQASGGAVNIRNLSGPPGGTVTVRRTRFEANRIAGNVVDLSIGAGIAVVGGDRLDSCLIEESAFLDNFVLDGGADTRGAGAYLAADSVGVAGSAFERNGATAISDSPAGLPPGGALAVDALEAEVRDCSITDNLFLLSVPYGSEDFSPGAAGLVVDAPRITVDRTRIVDNRAGVFLPDPGQIDRIAGGAAFATGSATIANSLIAGNSGREAGGVVIASLPGAIGSSIINTTIAGNEATGEGPGGVYSEHPLVLANSIVWMNRAERASAIDREIELAPGSSAEFCLIGGWDGSLPGAENLDADPRFVEPAFHDYRVQPGSPAIDSGSNELLLPGLDAFDLAGGARRVDDPASPDTGAGPSPVVDRGAFEFAPGLCGPADLAEPTGVLDLADVVSFVVAFVNESPAADLAEPTGVLDLADVVSFVVAFVNESPAADLAEPFGVWDGGDITAFVQAFAAGCP